jgi:hypothetical protein
VFSLFRFFPILTVLTGPLLLAACVWDDPRYPVYYRYAVDVKVDGQPVRIERVIKCTGTKVTGSTYAPGVTTGGTYANPPVIGAKVPGTKAAVYTPVVGACRWASARAEEIEAEKGRVHRFLARPLTDDHKYLPPGSKLPVLWVKNAETFEQMEYYVSERTLSGIDSHVEFVEAHPPVKVDRKAFRKSEKRAETASPDLTPFFFPRNQTAAKDLQLYKDRFGKAESGYRVATVCHAAWRIPRGEWSKVDGLEDWVEALPNDGRAYIISDDYWPSFTAALPFKGGRNTPSLGPVGYAPDREREKIGRFAFYDSIHPVISTDQGRFVDLNRTGAFGCDYEVLFPERSQGAWSIRTRSNEGSFGGSYSVNRDGGLLRAAFSPLVLVYVRELDEFIVFMSLGVGTRIDEPVVKGWKE